MGLACQCPSAAAIVSVPNVTCPENFGQIQKIAFQRLKKADGTANAFSSLTEIQTASKWETLLSAEDGSKIVITPYVYAPADSGGDARMSSGGNDDLGGIPETLGGNPVQFTAQLRSVPQAVAKALKSLACEANAGNLGVFLFDENGKIEAIKDGSSYKPIPVRGFFVSDKIHGNYDAKDSNTISWYYQEGYSDNLEIIAPEFNPLTDLDNAAA